MSGGRIIPDAVARQIEDAMFQRSIYAIQVRGTFTPPTRRQRMRYRLRDYRERIGMAVAVLRGRHDCGDDW